MEWQMISINKKSVRSKPYVFFKSTITLLRLKTVFLKYRYRMYQISC